MRRIGGRLRSAPCGGRGANVEIPPFVEFGSNRAPWSGAGTAAAGQFDWGGRLLKSNGGAQRFPQAGWKSAVECIGTRELDCEAYTPSRDESRAKWSSDPAWKGPGLTDKSYPGDNRLISPERPQRRGGLAPQLIGVCLVDNTRQ